MNPRALRFVLLNGAIVSAALAGALFWQHAQRAPDIGFAPPADDVCIVPPSRASLAHPYDPASGLAMYDARPIPADARCTICGMYPSRFPRWAAQLIFNDGGAHYFDSPVDLFMFLADPSRFDAQHMADAAAALYVSDYRGGGWVDARRAFFVAGSSARGPMRGPDLPAFTDAASAAAFVADHGGRTVGFAEIDAILFASLREANHAHHMH